MYSLEYSSYILDKHSFTPLIFAAQNAAQNGGLDVAKLLIEKKASVDAKGISILRLLALLNTHHTF